MRYLKEKILGQASISASILLIITVILMGYSSLTFAKITQIQDRNKCPGNCWEVSGVIEKADLQQLASAVNIMKKTKATPYFRLNSNGGDLEVAIAIGRQLRKFHATALTWDQGQCYSSCVFIYAGAVKRVHSQSIGIHRPYTVRADVRDYQDIQNDQRRIAKLAKEYLEEVNVLPSLYDAMVSIPPDRIKLLTEAELDQYGLLQLDPAEQEHEDNASARKYGISIGEFVRRQSQVNITCANAYQYGVNTNRFEVYNNCKEDVLRGMR